jgi:sugar lactone lactonase YvrE
MRITLAVLLVILTFHLGCADEGPIQPTGPKLTVSPAIVSVETGADPITLNAVPQNGTLTGDVNWEVLSGNSGALSATTGTTVNFTSSALGTAGGTVVVKATGTVGEKTQSGASTITVQPSTKGRIFLTINLNGAPGAVHLSGPSLSPDAGFTQTGPTPLIDPGIYNIAPDNGLVVLGQTVDSVFDGLVSIDGGTPDSPSANLAVVANAQSKAQVDFVLRGGRGRLWVPASDNLLGYTENDLFVTQVSDTGFSAPGGRAIAFDADGNLWATSPTGVQMYQASVLGQPNAAPSRTVTVNDAKGIAVNGDTVLVASGADGKVYRLFRSTQDAPAAFITGVSGPRGVAFDSAGKVWVASSGAVARYPATGGGSSETSVAFADALGVAIDVNGGVWASSCSGNRVQQLTPSVGTAITDPDFLICPGGLAFDNSGALWVLSKGQGPSFDGALVRIAGPAAGGVGNAITPMHQVDFGGIAFSPAKVGLPVHQ